jgi:aminoglycoside phosphotransferase (APT) family kinase protein
VGERHRFDEAALARWMGEHLEGFRGPLTVAKFKGGQSNPTYFLATPGKHYVMRRKPPGKLLPSAHAVDREYRAIAALHPTGFPVPRPYALCTDDAVIGTWFYIMDNVEGRVMWDMLMPECSPQHRRKVYESEVTTLAQLHTTDYKAVGLEDFGKAGNYFARQIGRWSKQYQLSETKKIPEMDRLIEWLPQSIPPGETTTIVHGDYKLDNMVLHPTEPRVAAVLDWELCTIGDPLGDFTYLLMNWAPGRSMLSTVDKKAHGVPEMEEIVALYCEKTGRTGVPNLDWYFSYNQFRLAAILQGILGRVRDGTAANANAAAVELRLGPLAQSAYEFAQRAGMSG